ncbi:MAG TPA: VOC family protein [Candidatus Limnocylindria bacterium]|nr:VOC family protein [Candidatus Limnocylindria bacterium]
MRLDGVRVFVPDCPAALEAYTRLLGMSPARVDDDLWRFQLERGAVELTAGEGAEPHLAVLFAAERGDDLGAWPQDHGGLDVLVVSELPPPPLPAGAGISAIDHVVVSTSDPERAVAHWRDRLGLRLALDQTFAERGVRLLFFRSGGLTLEYAYSLEGADQSADDRVYGVSYRVGDLRAVRARLLAAGIEVTEPRAGMKAGTTVATVRSGTAGVPTLLIQQPPRA